MARKVMNKKALAEKASKQAEKATGTAKKSLNDAKKNLKDAGTKGTPEKPKMSTAEALSLHKAAQGAAKAIDQGFIALGRALAPIRSGGLYALKELGGFKNFEEYVDKGLCTSMASASKAITIYDKFNEIGADLDKVMEIGSAKAYVLASKVVEEGVDINSWLSHAKKVSTAQLEEDIKQDKLKPSHKKGKVIRGGTKVTIHSCSFRFTEEQFASIESAIAEAQEGLGLTSREAAVEAICVDWSMNHVPQGEALERWIATLERVYKCKLTVTKATEVAKGKAPAKKEKQKVGAEVEL